MASISTQNIQNRIPVSMSNKLYDIISKKIQDTWPMSCILFIDIVNNQELEKSYNCRREMVKNTRGFVEELQLFHGTHADFIDPICNNGFDPTRNTVSAYGRDSYFAKNASYSFKYMKSKDTTGISYMFLCDVIVGLKIRGTNNFIINTELFDNSVDNIENPSIIVTPYSDGAFPRYVVAFHKEAL